MKRLNLPLLITSIALSSVVVTVGHSAAQDSGGARLLERANLREGGANTDSLLQSEPVLIFDVSGETLAGPVHRHLAIYNNGRVSLAEFSAAGELRNISTEIGGTSARAMARALEVAGASQLEDQRQAVLDVALTTVTVFEGDTDALAHTFSYWIPSGQYGAVQELVDSFLEQMLEEVEVAPRGRTHYE
jgi:hypothetical protein